MTPFPLPISHSPCVLHLHQPRLTCSRHWNAVCLVASLGGTRTQVARQTPRPLQSSRCSVYILRASLHVQVRTSRLYSLETTPHLSHRNHSPPGLIIRRLARPFRLAETRKAHIYRSTEPRYLPPSSATLVVFHDRGAGDCHHYAGPSAPFCRYKCVAICIASSTSALSRLHPIVINDPMRFCSVLFSGQFLPSS